LVVFLGFVSEAGSARAEAGENADAAPARHFGGQRVLGFGPSLGFYSGSGATLGVGSFVGVWISGGYMPILISGNDKQTQAAGFEFYNSAQVGADLAIVPWRPGKRSSFGLIGGYKFNSVLGHGGGGGATFSYDVGAKLALVVLAGVNVFPSAEQRLLENQGYPRDREAAFPWLQGGANLGLVFYP
jgi:hypothetical protein